MPMTDSETTQADDESNIASLVGDDDDQLVPDLANRLSAGIDALEDGDRTALTELMEALEDASQLLEATETMVQAIDFSAVLDTIDGDDLLEAIEIGEIPAAFEEGESEDVVKLGQVMNAINVLELLQTADIGELWGAKREFDESMDDLTGKDDHDGSDDDSILEKATTAVTGDDGDENGDLLGAGDDELIETEVGDVLERGSREALSEFDPQSGNMEQYEELIQQRAIEGVDAFRDALLRTHGTFERVVEANREKTRQTDRSTHSRNPTAASTIATDRGDLGSPTNYATMPRTVRHSSAPTRTHIYGRRFELERKRQGYDDD